MPRCLVCSHKDRQAIDAALVAGESLRDIARQYEISKDALFRHKENHLFANRGGEELNVFEQRLTSSENRITALEQDLKEHRKSQGHRLC